MDQTWGQYLRSMLAFSAVSVLFLYGMQRLQDYLLSFVGPHMAAVPANTAFNTAVSFTTNTNWQNYSGESTMTYLTQMSGLAVQNFMSAAVGLVVAIAMIRGFVRSRTGTLGNFWADVTHAVVRLLLPAVRCRRDRPDGRRRDRQLLRLPHGDHAVRRAPDHGRRPGGLAGGHQGDGEQRRRILQRQLRPPVREPEPVHQPVRDLPAAADPVRHAAGVRQDGQGQPAGLRPGRDHGRSSGWPRSAGSASSRRTPPPAAPRRSPRATPRRAPRSGSAHRPARCSPRPRR